MGLASYKWRKDVTLGTAALISADVNDCVIEVEFTSAEADFWAYQDGNGNFVRWTLTDDTLLKFHYQRYDVINKIAIWHIRVPVSFAVSDTILRCQYGTATPTDGSDRAGVYDTSTLIAAHYSVNQPGGAFIDATGNYPATNIGTTDVAGIVGRGRLGSGGTQYMNHGSVTELQGASKVTVECSMQRSSLADHASITKMIGSDWNNRFELAHWSDHNVYASVNNGALAYGTYYLPDANMHHYMMIFDGTKAGNANRLILIVDGIQRTLSFTGIIPATVSSRVSDLMVGANPTSSLSNAIFDEFYVSTTNRSADWCALRNASVKGTLITSIGAQKDNHSLVGSITATSHLSATRLTPVGNAILGSVFGKARLAGGISSNIIVTPRRIPSRSFGRNIQIAGR